MNALLRSGFTHVSKSCRASRASATRRVVACVQYANCTHASYAPGLGDRPIAAAAAATPSSISEPPDSFFFDAATPSMSSGGAASPSVSAASTPASADPGGAAPISEDPASVDLSGPSSVHAVGRREQIAWNASHMHAFGITIHGW
eukprot:31499-Pelagococcus_subviridis.AAC.47